jgi:hypothetical protein
MPTVTMPGIMAPLAEGRASSLAAHRGTGRFTSVNDGTPGGGYAFFSDRKTTTISALRSPFSLTTLSL